MAKINPINFGPAERNEIERLIKAYLAQRLVVTSPILTDSIGDGQVTYAKIQDVTALSILGSILGGTVEEIPCTLLGLSILDAADVDEVLTILDIDTVIGDALADHIADSDPHTQYQLESEKNQPSGYAGLDGSTKLNGAQQTYGTLSNTACEGNDSRLPTDDEKDALGGTDGSPSSSNKYVTNSDSRNTDARTPLSHTHGNISNSGAIGSTSGLPIKTGTSGILEAGAFGSSSGTFCEGSDSRLSDSRTPTGSAGGQLSGTYPNPGIANVGAAGNILLSAGSNALVSSADLVFNDTTDQITINGGSYPYAGHLQLLIDNSGYGMILKQTTSASGVFVRCLSASNEVYFELTPGGSPRSYYTTCQLIGFEHPNYTGCLDFFTSSTLVNLRVGTPSGGSGSAPVRWTLTSTGGMTHWYDGSNYCVYTVDSSGNLSIAPSGSTITLSKPTEVTGRITSDGYPVGRVLYRNTADSTTVSNTVAETDLDINFSLPAGFLNSVGRMLKVELMCDHGATGTPTATFKLKFGSTVLSTSAAMRMTNNTGSSCVWVVECRSTGATGSLKAAFESALSGTAVGMGPSVTTGSFDLTASHTVQCSVTMSVANSLNTTTGIHLIITALNC